MNDVEYMTVALDLAREALMAGEFPVGCVIASEEGVLVKGSRTGTLGAFKNEIDHAEIIAIKHLSSLEKAADKRPLTLFSTLEPCLMCFGAIILSGIGRVVYAYEDVMGGGTSCDLGKLSPLYADSRVSVIPNVLRRESLDLFKRYFSHPENTYWKGSLLERYTIGLKGV